MAMEVQIILSSSLAAYQIIISKKRRLRKKVGKNGWEIYMMFYRVLVSILHIKIARKSCQNRKIEYGMRRISITTADIEILKGYFFQTTA